MLYRHSPITSAERANATRAVSASRLAVVSCVVMATRSVTSLITMMRDPSSGEMPTDEIAGKRSPLLRRKVASYSPPHSRITVAMSARIPSTCSGGQ